MAGCRRVGGPPAVAAVAQGNDPPLAHREHAVGPVIPTPAVVGVNPWRPHADHDQLAGAGDLLKLGPQAVLGPVPQHLLQLLAAVADLRGGVLQGRIQIGPLQLRVNELQHRGKVAAGIGLVGASDQLGVLLRHGCSSRVAQPNASRRAEAPGPVDLRLVTCRVAASSTPAPPLEAYLRLTPASGVRVEERRHPEEGDPTLGVVGDALRRRHGDPATHIDPAQVARLLAVVRARLAEAPDHA
jgi:hypothetical protein